MYYGVAGRDISYNDAVLFLTLKEAQDHADSKEKALNESRSASQRKVSA